MLIRKIGCIHYAFINKVFTKHNNPSCWAGIRTYLVDKGPKYVYITNYDMTETRKYQPLLIGLINEITPCVFLKRENVVYIKYQLLKGYNRNLVLLNFIRNLWDNPLAYQNKDYTKVFFETLEKSKLKDPLERLTEANMEACKLQTALFNPDHSNASTGVLIRNSKDLLSNDYQDIASTANFLKKQ